MSALWQPHTECQSIGAAYPIGAYEEADPSVASLISAAELKAEYIAGIPLYSQVIDQKTRLPIFRLTDDIAEKFIKKALLRIEQRTKLTLVERKFREKKPFDRAEWDTYGYMRLNNRPVTAIESMTVRLAGNQVLFMVPPDWIDPGNLRVGQINLLPMGVTNLPGGHEAVPIGPGGAPFLALHARDSWVPSWFEICYRAGFPGGQYPGVLNDAIGMEASIAILSLLGATRLTNSASLGIDGLSQSVGTMGPNVYQTRLEWLEGRLREICNGMRTEYGTKLFSGSA